MTTRRTSALVYRQIQEEGLLSKLRFQVYAVLYDHGPLTCKEVLRYLPDGVERDSVSPRMKELVRLGVVAEHGERLCTVSDRQAVLWDVTDQLPVKPEASPKTTPTKAAVVPDSRLQDLYAALAPFAGLFDAKNPVPLQSLFVSRADLERAAAVYARKDLA